LTTETTATSTSSYYLTLLNIIRCRLVAATQLLLSTVFHLWSLR